MTTNNEWNGNKGDWGEAFVLLHLLSDAILYNGDDDLKRIETEYSEVKEIYRREVSGNDVVFHIDKDNKNVIVSINGEIVDVVPQSVFAEKAHTLFLGIQKIKNGNASLPEQEFLRSLGCESVKASNTQKADLIARVIDGLLATEANRNYSIKTIIGGKPTLLNVSNHTFFTFELQGMTAEQAAEVMNITGNAWVQARVRKCFELCDKVVFHEIPSTIFANNLRECHWRCPEVAAYGLLESYFVKGKRLPDVIANLKKKNPLNLDPETEEINCYERALRKMIWAVVFGMVPGTVWEDEDTVDGYLIAKNDEEILSYQVSRRNLFENYLLNHSSFDTPDNRMSKTLRTGKPHDLNKNCTIFEKDGKFYLWLALQIRFEPEKYEGTNLIS